MKKNGRMFLFRLLTVAGIAIVFFRVVQVQLYYGERLKRWARSQERELELKGQRGKIRDREGRDLASSVETLSFFADPNEIENFRAFSLKVGRMLQISPFEIENKLMVGQSKRFLWLRRQVDAKTRNAFESVKNNTVEGLGVIREYRREYPQGDLLAPLIGRVSIDGDGIEGVEKQFDKQLQGGVSLVKTPRDARGRLFYVDKDQLLSKGEAGKDIYLTIDLHLQSLVETALDNFKKKYSADSAMALVVDPNTNEILVWAQNPRTNKNGSTFKNFAATDPIEPGSVVKPLLFAWGLERNFVHEKTVFDIPGGEIKIGDKVFKDKGHQLREHLTPEEILKYSSNVGAVKLGQRMGFRDVWSIFEQVGFTEKTGLQLMSESRGIVHKPKDYQKVEQATMAFGQGMAVTPLQLTRAFTVLAGDGSLRPLKVFKDMPLPTEEKTEKVLTPKTLGRIRKLMEASLLDGGTAVSARVEGYNVAGKTGTSQVSAGRKGYAVDSYWTSFIGFLPSEDPKFLIYVAFDNPKGEKTNTGGHTAAPLFAEIAKLCLRNDEALPPTRVPEIEEVTRDLAQTSSANSDAAVKGMTGEVTDEAAMIAANEPEIPGEGEALLVPPFMGMHLKNALKTADKYNFDVKIRGRGQFVLHQYPASGTILKKQRQVVLFLK